eukprot:TRINITY_DN1908_c0_g1_i3.p1 TRINITY_DN1908_c0_g1~~TRINITY_DN1908_c0_g1_i3.p1  ORF type:complete len:299 (+),score=67.55 TRINITY_DN1908_c0_g1_i3:635-1531(+)
MFTHPAAHPQPYQQLQPTVNYSQLHHNNNNSNNSSNNNTNNQQQPQRASSCSEDLASLCNSGNNSNNSLPLFVPQVATCGTLGHAGSSPTLSQRMLSRVSGLRTCLRSPRAVIAGGCFELLALLFFFSRLNILEGDYFRLGPPVLLFQYEVADKTDFYMILAVFFFHQVTYTWITETLNPWLLNEVQDQKCDTIRYSKPVTLWVINLYTAFLTLNNILVLNIAFSQASFLVVVLLADVVSTTLLNLSYIWHKTTATTAGSAAADLLAYGPGPAYGDDEEAQLLVLKKGYANIPTKSQS